MYRIPIIELRFIIILILFVPALCCSQQDSLKTERVSSCGLREFVAPASLLSLGIGIEVSGKKEDLQRHFFNTDTKLDDYLQYSPLIALYSADFLGVGGRNTTWKKTKIIIISQLSNALITRGIKEIFDHQRPNGGQLSFPSGHTSAAFVNAAILYEEYKHENSWLALSGYAMATATAVLRVSNDAHWLSDVLVGASIGIIIPKIVYSIDDNQNAKDKKLAFIPLWTGGSRFGFSLIYPLN